MVAKQEGWVVFNDLEQKLEIDRLDVRSIPLDSIEFDPFKF